ncbi:hypothetical protein B0H14DRAFT_795104 [Mycena olivaceomarginata]|nr:hypothetical protein B0H14DRAFT_795104 [Mycena olivaceomarginata]
MSAGAGAMGTSNSLAPPSAPSSAPRTPRRQSLHKSVLIRSAQRAVWAGELCAFVGLEFGVHTPASNSSSKSNSTSSTLSVGARPVVRGGCNLRLPRRVLLHLWSPTTQDEIDTDTGGGGGGVLRLGLEVVSVSSGSDVSDDDEDEQDEEEVKLTPADFPEDIDAEDENVNELNDGNDNYQNEGNDKNTNEVGVYFALWYGG